ncbi:MAG: hypothetical protein EOO75_17805 [Myxococcales bacterium]|nr:MAG: hypothetical protein EOO75_17805 [Myxococcales bacterium]
MVAFDLKKDMLQWFVSTFGKDVLLYTADALQHQWSRLFKTRTILILGPKQAGKSTLLQFMRSGQPYEVVGDELRTPAPTAMAAVVDQKFAADKKNWLRLKRDVPGDLDLRDTWAQAIADVKPHGIIYLLDGRRSDEQLRADVQDIVPHVLVHYAESLGHLAALHVFVNFCDGWGSGAPEQRRRLRLVRDELEDLVTATPSCAALRLDVAATQLSPNLQAWPEVERALRHFGADIAL